jgi:hypothetical protein
MRCIEMQKVDDAVGLLVEGQPYLVPTVTGSLGGSGPMECYPIIGPRHYDVEFLNVHMPHYHLDLRFIDMRKFDNNVVVGAGQRSDGTYPPIVYKKMKCLQACVVISNVRGNGYAAADGYRHLVEHFCGVQCSGNAKDGWICPHKGMPLASQPVGAQLPTLTSRRQDWRSNVW